MNQPDSQSQMLKELEALRCRVAELEARGATTPARAASRRMPLLLGSLAALLAVGVGTAFAANGNCPNGLPFCFAANAPANASEVNHNFAQLKEWLERKTGAVSSAEVTTSRLNTTDISLNGGKLVGSNSSGNLHIESPTNGLYLNWFSGTGGVIIGNGAQGQAARIETNGNLQIATVNNRRTATVVKLACATGACTATCAPGVVKYAWGFHGANVNANIGGNWECGGGREWMGSCVGNQTCTVTTACGSSSLFLECW